MKIGMAARAAGVSPSTIRYYEAVGIIDWAPRVSGTRSYQPEIIDELKALRYLRANGLSIRSLASIAKLPRGSAARRDIWVTVMQAQIADIKERIREAEAMQRRLERAVACHCDGQAGRCTVVRDARAMTASSATLRPA